MHQQINETAQKLAGIIFMNPKVISSSNNPRYLTKSRFKLALECPTKLFYTNRPDYYDRNKDNDFLQALAEGGYQIGALAKFKYHPDPVGSGITVESLDHAVALRETREKLQQPGRVVIAEAALCHENYFVRVDILVRDEENRTVELIEVKSKGIDLAMADDPFRKDGRYHSEWLPYLYDIAFQSEVARWVFPDYTIKPYLLLVDKNAVCDTDFLHQKFRIIQRPSEHGKPRIDIESPPGLVRQDLGDLSLLVQVDVGNIVNDLRGVRIESLPHIPDDMGRSLPQFMGWAAGLYRKGDRFFGCVSKMCKACQFRAGTSDKEKSGLHECWKLAIDKGQIAGHPGLDPSERSIPLSIDIWGGAAGRRSLATDVLSKRRAFLADIQEGDVLSSEKQNAGMTGFERRMAQVNAARGGNRLVLDEEKLAEMDQWEWPLHMIDFETSAPAIPFFSGMRPYQTLAFQFSHHVMERWRDKVISVRHANQWISTASGAYPNIEFVRQLRKALMPHDRLEGTVFRYHHHENTVLRSLRSEIDAKRSEIHDAKDLIEFIELITKPKKGQNVNGG